MVTSGEVLRVKRLAAPRAAPEIGTPPVVQVSDMCGLKGLASSGARALAIRQAQDEGY
jgi:hypothetical protein